MILTLPARLRDAADVLEELSALAGYVHLGERLTSDQKLWRIREAHREYEAALKRREHGGVAAADFIEAVVDVLELP